MNRCVDIDKLPGRLGEIDTDWGVPISERGDDEIGSAVKYVSHGTLDSMGRLVRVEENHLRRLYN